MPQDAFTLRVLCEELHATFKGGKINKIVEPSENEVVLTIYTGKKTERLVLDVNPARPRIGIGGTDTESPLTAPNFCMLLRKHLLNASVEEISILGFDRIVKITLLSSAEFSDAKEKILFVELMGRYSNIILTEDGKILGGNRGINFFDAGIRPLIVGRKYTLPPTNGKLEPNAENLQEKICEFSGDNLAEYLCGIVQGIATSTAEELILAYEKSLTTAVDKPWKFDKKSAENFVRFAREFLYNPPKKPCVIERDEKVVDVCVFPYETVQGKVVEYSTLLLAERDYFTRKILEKRLKDKTERISSVLRAAEKKAQKRLSAVMGKFRDAEDGETDKINGELILANVYKIKKGDKSVTVQNYYDDYKEITIPLNEFLTPAENAENCYKRYSKKKRTLTSLAPQKQKAEEEVAYIRSVLEEFNLCETEEDLDGVLAELKEYGLVKEQSNQKKKKTQSIGRTYIIDGYTVKVGKNNVENDYLTQTARSKDIWVHSKDYHSAHAIICYDGKPVLERVIRCTAEIVAYYSKARESGKTEIAYTEKRFVKKPNGAKPGFCVYTDFKTITVNSNKHAEFLKSE